MEKCLNDNNNFMYHNIFTILTFKKKFDYFSLLPFLNPTFFYSSNKEKNDK
jgi:hypothetical protein